MTLDTLAFAKHLEQAGIDRQHAEAHAEAMNRYVLPDLATKTDLAALRQDIAATIHTAQLQSLGITAAMLGILFALLKLT